jgi:hypothetical protein
MTRTLQKLVREKKKATDRLENEILVEMVRIAKRKDLSCIMLLPYGNCYKRGDDDDVEVPELDKLDDLYSEEVHPGGLQGLWTPERGWR